MEEESGLTGVSWGWGLGAVGVVGGGGNGMGNGIKSCFRGEENILELDRVDSYTALWIY